MDHYFLKSQIFVLSSFTEGFPNALIEAVSIGLPCISTNCLSGQLELLNNGVEIEIPKNGFFRADYGILVNSDDETGLVKALNHLKINPRERMHYSRKSLERARKYDLDIIYEGFKGFINN